MFISIPVLFVFLSVVLIILSCCSYQLLEKNKKIKEQKKEDVVIKNNWPYQINEVYIWESFGNFWEINNNILIKEYGEKGEIGKSFVIVEDPETKQSSLFVLKFINDDYFYICVFNT